MVTLSNYTVGEQIYEGTDTLLYRGFRDGDCRPVVIKLSSSEQPTAREIARLRHEFAMLQAIDSPRVVRAYALEKHEHGVALVLEALDGHTLGELLRAGRLGLKKALHIAAAIAEILEDVHRLGIIHRDIKPHNILVHDATGDVYLIDFGMATSMTQEVRQADGSRTIEGTLAYLSPEQTGYMNRPLDHRSDLYSLGVTLFQMLTGSLPFTSEDARELVRSHVARIPPAPRDLNAALPVAVSDLVMKLLTKAPEERYQSALGLGADLAECLRQIEATGTVGVLELGRRDAAAVLRLSQKLYGRADEEAALLAAVERAESGAVELFLVAGHSGIGKSSLVQATQKAVERRGGHFISGKFDQLSRNVPYAPVARAFRNLLGQLLGESAELVSRWRDRLARALGQSGQVLVDLLPELALLLGPQPAVPALQPTESQNRFNRLMSRFADVFTTASHPLVLFLDDLQWADAGSLKLLHVLLAAPGRRHLLILGAYRDSEVHAAHPLSLALVGLCGAGVAVREIALGPLGAPQIAELLEHALSEGAARVASLSEVILEKTQGNPFFVGQFLRSLHAERLIRFDESADAWTWDLGEIAGREVTGNVVEFMAGKLLRLAPATQRALTLAACIGHEFDLQTLVTLHEQPPATVAAALGEALREGLVLPVRVDHRFLHGALEGSADAKERAADVEVRYRFLHDRVQQAAYSLIADADRAATHLFIGRLMLAGRTSEGHDEALFDLMGHLNVGAPLVTDALERTMFAELDLAAGRRAKASNAYETAAECLRAGAAFLPESAWATRHELCFALHLEQAECEYLSGRFEQAEGLFQLLLDRARSNVEKASVFTLQLKLYQVAGRYDDGVTLALRELQRFDLQLPSTDEAIQEAMAAASKEIFELLGGRQIPELIDHPLMTDPEHRAVLQMLNSLLPCAYIGRPRLFPLSAMKAVAFSLRHGNAPESCFAYSIYGLMLVSVFGDIPAGFQFSEMSIQLNERFGDTAQRGSLLHLHGDHINFWRRHIRTGFPFLERAFEACLAAGDLVYAGYLAFETVWQAVERGDALDDVLQLSEPFAAFARQSKNEAVYQTIRLEQRFARCLKGTTPLDPPLEDDGFNEAESLGAVTQASFGCGIAFHHILKLILLYTAGRHEEALAAAAAARSVLGAVMAMPIEATFHLYEALALLARGAPADVEAARRDRALLDGDLEKLALWARHSPENFEHKHRLVLAEAARVAGHHLEAEALYDQAIEGAEEGGFVQYAALANELAGRALISRGRGHIAPVYLRAAHAGYVRWGASAVAQRVAQTHPKLLRDSASGRPRSESAAGSSSGARRRARLDDVTTVMRLGEAFAGEIELPSLLEGLMRVVLRNTGAARACLVLDREGALMVEAAISVDPELVTVGIGVPVEAYGELPGSVVHYVARTREAVALGDAGCDARFAKDPCVVARGLRSILGLPMVHRRRLVGVLYLENGLVPDAFSEGSVEFLETLCSQAATSIENALLYGRVREGSAALQRSNERLESEVAQRTEALREANAQILREFEERARTEHARAGLQQEMIQAQNELLLELSTPLIPITDQIMVLPLIGSMDARRAAQVTETALAGAQRRGTRVVIVDVTGLRAVDSDVAAALVRTAVALRLLGTHAVLTGVSPSMALTLAALDIDLGGLVTCGSLQSGIVYSTRIANSRP